MEVLKDALLFGGESAGSRGAETVVPGVNYRKRLEQLAVSALSGSRPKRVSARSRHERKGKSRSRREEYGAVPHWEEIRGAAAGPRPPNSA